MDKIKLIDEQQLRKDIPEFKVGDEIKVMVKIVEADKVRVHPFQGIVIARRGKGMGATFTVRKVSYGESVERVFPLHSPTIEKIERVKKGSVRAAKLYYMSDRFGKAARIKEKEQENAA